MPVLCHQPPHRHQCSASPQELSLRAKLDHVGRGRQKQQRRAAAVHSQLWRAARRPLPTNAEQRPPRVVQRAAVGHVPSAGSMRGGQQVCVRGAGGRGGGGRGSKAKGCAQGNQGAKRAAGASAHLGGAQIGLEPVQQVGVRHVQQLWERCTAIPLLPAGCHHIPGGQVLAFGMEGQLSGAVNHVGCLLYRQGVRHRAPAAGQMGRSSGPVGRTALRTVAPGQAGWVRHCRLLTTAAAADGQPAGRIWVHTCALGPCSPALLLCSWPGVRGWKCGRDWPNSDYVFCADFRKQPRQHRAIDADAPTAQLGAVQSSYSSDKLGESPCELRSLPAVLFKPLRCFWLQYGLPPHTFNLQYNTRQSPHGSIGPAHFAGHEDPGARQPSQAGCRGHPCSRQQRLGHPVD